MWTPASWAHFQSCAPRGKIQPSVLLLSKLSLWHLKILFPSPFPSPHIPPELTVCDYKHTIRLPKASWCNAFSLPSPPNKLFFFPIPGTSWQRVLIRHSQQGENTERGKKIGQRRQKNWRCWWGRNWVMQTVTAWWRMFSFISCFFL